MAMFAWGTVFYGNGVYLVALHKLHGWSVADISLGVGLFFFAGIPGAIVVGICVDRFGPRWIATYGALAIGIAVASLGIIEHRWTFYLVMLLMGTGYPALATPIISATLLPWFADGYGFALGIALTGASVGGALFVPAMVFAIERWGFGPTVLTVGALVVVVIMPFAIALLNQPGLGRATQGARQKLPRSLLRHLDFWRLSIGCALGLGAQVGFLTHQLSVLEKNMSVSTAALAISATVVSSAVGRLVFGGLASRFPLHVVTASAYVLQGVGILWLALAWEDWQRLVACIVAGFSIGAIVMLPALLVRERYGNAVYGRAYGSVNVTLYLFAAAGPALTGVISDFFASYALALLLLFAAHALASALIGGRSFRLAS
ncbi:MAG: MFS transporter [Gammaproteobacteria bacterium]|nr:MFS transporter [Gammaproteobacteria bacterium]